MFKGFKRNAGDFTLRHSSLSIIMIYNIVTIVVFIIFYFIMPILMGYAPDFMESTEAIGVSYLSQFVVGGILCILIGSVIFAFLFKDMNKWQKVSHDTEEGRKIISKIRRKSINLPYLIFICQTIVVGIPILLVILAAGFILHAPTILLVRIFTVVFSLFTAVAVFSHVFSKNIFKRILLRTYNGEGLEGFRMKLTSKIFLQILPLFIVAILFTALLGYTRLMEDKGDMAYIIVKDKLHQSITSLKNIENAEEIVNALKDIKIEGLVLSSFAINPEGKTITSDGAPLNTTLAYFVKHPIKGDRVYGNTNEMQGVILKANGKSGEYIAGIVFQMNSEQTANYFVIAFLFLLVLNMFVLYYFSKSLKEEISLVAESLTEIAEGEYVDLDRKLAVISNDELGDLVIAFNKIQEKEKEYIREREEQQAIFMEQERLASLGQMIGGIAHNLRTPIMSLAGAIEGLKDLVKEYDTSIEDADVTKEDHHQIAKDMNEWLEKMKPHCAYMSDIITAVKEQTVQPMSEKGLYFTIDEIAKRVDILMNHELKRFKCKLHTEFDIDMNTKINGEVSLMVQVLNNLIINSIDAYEGTGGDIDFKILKKDNYVEFIVKDYAKGIPADVKEKLFKEMITTKGKKGTGLGLYMSYSNIKARFKGKMWFESEEGKGTEFHVAIPLK